MKTDYNLYLRAALTWLDLHYCKSGFFHIGSSVLNKYLTVLNHRGRVEAIKLSKDLRHSVYRWLSAGGYELFSSKSKQERILPRALYSQLSNIAADRIYPVIRLVLTAAYASRELKTPVVVNVETITAPPSFDKGVIRDMSNYVDSFWRALGSRSELRGRIPKDVLWKSFHLSTKTGPSGGQAMWSAYADITCLPDQLVGSIGVLGGKKLSQKMCYLRNLSSDNPLARYFNVHESKRRFRKVSPIQSQEGKTREVAILDYWSQTSLRGLHRWLFKWLRRIPQDCTFDQGSFVQKIPDNGEPYYSIDLSAATDRFPIVLIETVLAGRFPKHYVEAWRDVMVGYPFEVSDGSVISYSVGNPMGAYSSWNSFALSHHFVMYYCCKSLKINWSEAPYVILGDDVLIRHKLLAEKYMEVVKSLGIEVSSSKTHVSLYFREFAKRVFFKDIELTPFPISALWTTRKSLPLTLNVLVSEGVKGWLAAERTPDILADLYRLLKLPLRVRKVRQKILNIAYDLLVGLQGRIEAESALKPSLVRYYPALCETGRSVNYNLVLKSVVMEAFAKSANPKDGSVALGDVAVELVCLITDPEFESYLVPPPGELEISWTSFDLIYALPVLQVHGLVSEKYGEIRREVFESLTEGDWKLTLRALTIPLSDRIYYSRNEDVRPIASFSLAKILDAKLRDVIERGQAEGFSEELVSSIKKSLHG
jgi:hypothetical protein